MKQHSTGLTALTLLFLSLHVKAQEFKANIKDLIFMQGKWQLKHQWGDMEEFWGAPMGDNMISSYRCVKDGKIVFYEFVVIEQKGQVPVMYLRHFNPGSIGWEEKSAPNPYPLISLKNKHAVFRGSDGTELSYTLKSPDKLEVMLKEKNKEGKEETTVFPYTK